VKVPEKLTEFKALEVERLKEEAIREAEEAKQQSSVNNVNNQEKYDQFSKLWNNEDNLNEEQCKGDYASVIVCL
jgi:protein required for attachment to host cells